RSVPTAACAVRARRRRTTKQAEVLASACSRPESYPMAVQPRLPPMNHYARATVTVVAVLAVLAAAWAVRNILLLVLVAAVLAVGLDPAVRRLERWHVRRGWAVFLIFFAAVAFIALFAALVVPPLVRQVTKLASDIP